MRKLITLFILACSLHASAASINAITIWMASGKQIVCMLDDQPIVTFEGEELVMTTHMNTVKYNAADVLKFTYSSIEQSSIENASIPETRFSIIDNTINVYNLDPTSEIIVFSVDGVQLASSKADSKGRAVVTLPSQTSNVYVVKTSVANFKIVKP